MNPLLEKYCIDEKSSLEDSLKRINQNKHEFLVVVSGDYEARGALTIGDAMRALLGGKAMGEPITGLFKQEFRYLTAKSDFREVAEEFKNPVIRFLPVLDEKNKLVNIITKKQFHTYMLMDMPFDVMYDFFSLDENAGDHEVYGKPWGFYKTVFLNDYSRAKVISVFPESELSFQEHAKRDEHWVIIKGEGEIVLDGQRKLAKPGNYFNIPKGVKHTIKNLSKTKTLMISEVQLGNYFGEDDIIRHSDKYGRH